MRRAPVIPALWLASALAAPALAQSIDVESLDAPKAFAPGIEIENALAAESWQGTGSDRAERLLREMNVATDHPVVRAMLRRVVLSGLVPPDGAGDEFERLRIRAAQALATPDEYARFAARNAASQAPRLRAEAYLAQGEMMQACEISDTIVQGRAESDWVRLRAACHEARGEEAAAELARDILRDRGEPTDIVLGDKPEGFWLEMMAMDQPTLLAFMEERADYPEPEIVESVIDDSPAAESPQQDAPLNLLAPQTLPETEPEPDPEPFIVEPFYLDDALSDETERGTARLFELGRKGDAAAVAAFVTRARRAGLDPDRVLSRIPALLDPTQMTAVDLPLFARHAVATRDIPMIQALYVATEGENIRERLALASDALGNGYIGRALGEGLETALTDGDDGAVRDVMLALGLGALLSENIEPALLSAMDDPRPSPDWIPIDQAVDRGAVAEALLRIAAQVDANSDSWSLYQALRSLREAGFADEAGQLAAYEFLRGIDG